MLEKGSQKWENGNSKNAPAKTHQRNEVLKGFLGLFQRSWVVHDKVTLVSKTLAFMVQSVLIFF